MEKISPAVSIINGMIYFQTGASTDEAEAI
jgi:hypothetical protein